MARQADGTTDRTTSHLTNPAKNAGQVIGYSHSTKLPKFGSKVAGYHHERINKSAFALAKTQCVQQYPVIEYFRARQIGNCDVDVVDPYHFGHGAVCQADAEWQLKGSWSGSGSHLFSATKDIPTRSHFSRPLKEIFFALMAYRQHGHGLAVFDFKQRYITVCANGHDK